MPLEFLKHFLRKESLSSFVWAYTLLFAFLFLAIFGPMLFRGQSLIWCVDGVMQHYPFFVYEGEWLRGIISSILAGNPTIKLWDEGLGYGADVIITMGAYIGDPLNLLSVLAYPAQAEGLYSFLIILRIYFAGLAFVGFMRSKGYGLYEVMLGAISYSFCGWISTSLNHSFFIYPMIFFPLLLWGVDSYLQKKKPFLFVISVAGFFLTYFYFGYMACILLVPYCLYRAWQHEGGWKLKPILLWAIKFLGLLLLGVAISAVILLPILSTLLGSERLALTRNLPVLFPLATLAPLVSGLSGGIEFLGKDTYFGTSALCVFALATLFSSKDNRVLKAGVVVLVLGAFLPIFGKVMNGFAYYAERWTWALSFLLIYVQVRQTKKMLNPTKRSLVLLAAIGIVLILGSLASWRFSHHFNNIAPVLCMLVVFIYSFISFRIAKTRKGDSSLEKTRINKGLLMAVATVCVVFANWGFWYTGWSYGTGRQFEEMPFGQAYDAYFGQLPDNLVIDQDDDSFWRYDKTFSTPGQMNLPAVRGIKSSEFYSSLHNSYVDQFNTSMGVTSSHANSQMANLRSRSWLESFLGMKYFIAPIGNDVLLPYGVSHEPVKTMLSGDVEYGLYENELALGLATMFPDDFISEDDYYSMDLTSRQEALFSNVILDSDQITQREDVREAIVTSDDTKAKTISYEVADLSQGVHFNEVSPTSYEFVVTEPESTLRLVFEGDIGSDTFVQVENLSYSSNPDINEPSHRRDGLFGVVDLLKDWKRGSGEGYTVFFSRDDLGVLDYIDGVTPDSHVYGGKDDWLLNLGDQFQGETSVTLTFKYAGVYSFEEMKITSLPNDLLKEKAQALQRQSVNLVSSTNSYRYSGEIDEAGIILATIAWSKGWSATIDGNETALMRGDIAFLAMHLDEGLHDIELTYETPYLRVGAFISFLAVALLIGLTCYSRRVKRSPSC